MGRHWASFFPQDKLPQTVSSLGPFLPGTPLTREASTITKEVLHSSMFPACSSSWETSLHFQTLVQLSPLEKALLFLLAEDPIQGLVHSKHTLYHWAKSPVHQKTPPPLPPNSFTLLSFAPVHISLLFKAENLRGVDCISSFSVHTARSKRSGA